MAVIYLGFLLPGTSSGRAIMGSHNDTERGKDQPLFHGLASNRGLPSQHLSMLLVRSYRTFAPLPTKG